MQRLKDFLQANSHLHVPPDSDLGRWLEQQRALIKRGRLTPEQKVRQG